MFAHLISLDGAQVEVRESPRRLSHLVPNSARS